MSDRDTRSLSRSLMAGQSLEECELRVVEGPDVGRACTLGTGRLIVGADARCDLVLSDPTVSATHAEFALMEGGVRVRDLGSRNGVRFLGSRVASAVVQPGSVLALGHTSVGIFPRASSEPEPDTASEYGGLCAHSVARRRLIALLRRLEASAVTLLIEGESGSGKSFCSETIHRASGRTGPLVAFNCGATTAQLLPAELFGHRRGAFTGAVEDRPGAVESAAGGTLVLEEVGEVPLALQPLLLRFVETGQVQRLGEDRPRTIDARVIATSTRNLQQLVAERSFRADLYYRLSVVRLTMPALRDCPEDILPLTRQFLHEAGYDGQLGPALVASVASFGWPGNVRQLRNSLIRLRATGTLWDESLNESSGAAPDFQSCKARLLEHFEAEYLRALIQEHRGNLSAASRASGIVRNHLRHLLRKHGLDPATWR
jgi:two-component system, NtrC family, response regulator GlrR